MTMGIRTDLALEARLLRQEQAGKATELPGVRAREIKRRGITTTVVEVLNEEGVKNLGKAVGNYTTLELSQGLLRRPSGFAQAATQLGRALAAVLPARGAVLVVGVGNSAITPDSLGPKALEHLVVTRHLGRCFPQLRPVSAIAPGVLGTTGLESLEVVRGIVERAQPVAVVVVDALAARSPARICTTVQLTDTGITPGAGVGNRRAAFGEATLGVPVVAVGVPTVVEASTLLEDTLHGVGVKSQNQALCDASMVVAPKDIDARVERMARLVGYGLSLGLHRSLNLEDISCLVG